MFIHGDQRLNWRGQRLNCSDTTVVEVLREFGKSPDGRGAHLIGHGNGGLAAILAAVQRPDLVRSLALIQPAVFSAAADHPVVAAMLQREPGQPRSTRVLERVNFGPVASWARARVFVRAVGPDRCARAGPNPAAGG
jgi:pimeloyl-ACP methyl ester carboxylesterase